MKKSKILKTTFDRYWKHDLKLIVNRKTKRELPSFLKKISEKKAKKKAEENPITFFQLVG